MHLFLGFQFLHVGPIRTLILWMAMSKWQMPQRQRLKKPKTPTTPSALTSGSKTLFVGYPSYSVKRADVEEFFKAAGEVVDVRFASNEEGVFEGFGHVEFATGATAHKDRNLVCGNLDPRMGYYGGCRYWIQ
ncbi:nucleolin 1-like isoform X2 [Magnolia sinica]|uniref:nucleolin 1-like isoform X2 n=1 Tax=Magnolia sinica TaxID=86752 RepID=UPI00265B1E6C|nr:nucleolin 1-like isoform X2 [Magnolia sinica]XP_058104929.1 nucleolin 1-like isoform X2 [Magnolia sinica]